jgi:chromosome condensin MukBEF ATPase and DNA-binding subunit MukB
VDLRLWNSRGKIWGFATININIFMMTFDLGNVLTTMKGRISLGGV